MRADRINRPEGGSVQGVHKGAGLEKGDWRANKQNIEERGNACMDMDRGKNSNCVLRRLLFSCKELTACFFMRTLKASLVYVCLLHGR